MLLAQCYRLGCARRGFEVDKGRRWELVKLLSPNDGVDLVLSDLRLPDHDGLRLLAWMHEHNIYAPFIVMTNYAEVQNAVLCNEVGSSRLYCQARATDILLQKINDALDQNAQQVNPTPKTQNSKLKTQNPETAPRYIEGKSEASRQLYSYVELVAPTPMSVLILGASGHGKGICGTPHSRPQPAT